MKVFVVFGLLFAASEAKIDINIVGEMMEKITTAAAKCSEEVQPSPDDIAQLLRHEVPDSHEGKCMIFCVNKDIGFQNPDGSTNFEKGMEFFGKIKDDDPELFEKIHGAYKICEGSDYLDEDPCVSSVNLATCAIDEAKKAGIPYRMEDL
ncbi:hypothetical protein JTB14_032668 [Gonioctena quinquepunctata]|nr:hypothetical protein JTB14_032668 [Gonioctena quinquepunctata]